jgi:hypothetical protein
MFNEFQAQVIGFRECLELVRGDSRDGWEASEAGKFLVSKERLAGEILFAEETGRDRAIRKKVGRVIRLRRNCWASAAAGVFNVMAVCAAHDQTLNTVAIISNEVRENIG